jgi:hypothetical protein
MFAAMIIFISVTMIGVAAIVVLFIVHAAQKDIIMKHGVNTLAIPVRVAKIIQTNDSLPFAYQAVFKYQVNGQWLEVRSDPYTSAEQAQRFLSEKGLSVRYLPQKPQYALVTKLTAQS